MFRRVGGARVAEFFQTYYLAQNFGVGWIVKDVLYAAGLAFLLSAVNWRSPRSVALPVCKAACLWGVLLLANSVFYMIFSGGNMIVVTYPLVAALAIVCIRGLRVTSRIAQAGCFYMFFIYAVHSVDLLYALWTGSEGFDPATVASRFYEWIRCLLIFIFFVAVVTYLRICTTECYEYVDNAGVVILVIFMVIMAVLPDYAEKGTTLQNCITNFALWILQLLAYFMFYSGTKEHARHLEAQMVLLHQKEELEQLHVSQKNYENLQMLRHEVKNQYGYMQMMLREKQYDKLEKFFGECEDRVLETLPIVDCGNYVVNAILNMEGNKARYYGCRIEHKIAVPPRLPVADSDLCSVLTNLIDNAIEACARAALPPEACAIGVEVRQQNRSLFIRVTNPLGGISAGQALALQTSKKDAAPHGYGTKIVKKIAEKYCGCVRYSAQADTFVADVLLSLFPQEEAAKEA